MTYIPDRAIEMALATWYSVNNPLHFEAEHPCLGLVGEAGELLNLLKKDKYKPNFSWWNCKDCNHDKHNHEWRNAYKNGIECMNYTPLVLDELGDISYYLRILAYIKSVRFEEFCNSFDDTLINRDMLELLSELARYSSMVLQYRKQILYLEACVHVFLAILHKLDCTLPNLLELNYKKLNSEDTNHGWRHATVKSRM